MSGSGILSFGIHNSAQGIRNTVHLEYENHRRGIQNPIWIISNDARLIKGVLEEGGHINYRLGAKIGSRNTHF